MTRSVYNNVTPFGLLSPKMQEEFRTMRDAGHKIIMYETDGEWVNVNARSFGLSKVYRVKEGEVNDTRQHQGTPPQAHGGNG